MPYLDENCDIKNVHYDDLYKMPENLSDSDFIINIYKNILNEDVDHNTDGYKHWLFELENKKNRSV